MTLQKLKDYVLLLLGLYFLLPKFRILYKSLGNVWGLSKRRLIEQYKPVGEGAPWAIITGCTSGIGEAAAYKLAAEGFNIVLIGRNPDKLEEVERRIQLASPKAQTKLIVADLCKQACDLPTYRRIAFEISNLDVAILFNNAGVSYGDYFRKETPEHIRE